MGSILSRNGVDVSKQRGAFNELSQLQSKYGELALDAGLAAGGALPPPFGTAADVASLGKSLWSGTWGDVLVDVIGFAPIVGDGFKAGKVATKLVDLKRAVDVTAEGLQKSLNKTKALGSKYWDDIVKRNKAKYLEEVKKCGNNKKCREEAARIKGPQYNNTPRDGANGSWTSGERGDGTWTPKNGGPAIDYKNGFPDYSRFSKGDVDIPMVGDTKVDFRNADRAMRAKLNDQNWEMPSGYTWHHNQNGTTMQLIPQSVHATRDGASTPHMGGAAMYAGGQANEF